VWRKSGLIGSCFWGSCVGFSMATLRKERIPLTGRNNISDLASPISSSRRPTTSGPAGSVRGSPNSGRQAPPPSYGGVAATGLRPSSSNPATHSAPNSRRNSHNQDLAPQLLQLSDALARSLPNSARSEETTFSELSTAEVLRRMREKSEKETNAADQRDIDALGPYNAFSRPRRSMAMPLRSVLLDPTVNNFPPSRTRTELMKKIRLTAAPHPSYDLDKDGYVSQEDYRLAKRFDFDGNGVLDPDERAVGRRVLADEFFRAHEERGDLRNFGAHIASRTRKQNVDGLANAYSFERAYERLLSIERSLEARESGPIKSCLSLGDDSLTKHNFYVDKFDATAWNDFDAIPRSASSYGLENHGGSRKRLLFSRRQATVEGNQSKMDFAQVSTVRSCMNECLWLFGWWVC